MPEKRLTKKQKAERVLEKLETGGKKVWSCKIGFADCMDLPEGADAPMRRAVEAAFEKLTGYEADFNFSGWGGQLTDVEQSIVNEQFLRKLQK